MRHRDFVGTLLLSSLVAVCANAPAQEAEEPVVLYASDFASLDDGDFPAELTFRGGGMQIDRSQGEAMLRVNFFSLASTVVGAAIDRGSSSLPMANAQNRAFAEGVVPIRLAASGNQARIFVDGNQVVIHPAASLIRSDVIEFFYASVGSPGNGYLGSIRILGL